MSSSKSTSVEQHIEASIFAAGRLERPGQIDVYEGERWSDEGTLAEEFQERLKSFGIAEISKERLKKVECPPGLSSTEYEKSLLPPNVDIYTYLHRLADTQAGTADYPNDFEITLTIRLKDDVDALVTYESEEAGLICADCRHFDVEPGEPCEHSQGMYDYRTKYAIALVKNNPSH